MKLIPRSLGASRIYGTYFLKLVNCNNEAFIDVKLDLDLLFNYNEKFTLNPISELRLIKLGLDKNTVEAMIGEFCFNYNIAFHSLHARTLK